MNTREAAASLGLPARELYRLIDVGELRAYNVGRELWLRTDEVDSFRGIHPTFPAPLMGLMGIETAGLPYEPAEQELTYRVDAEGDAQIAHGFGVADRRKGLESP